MIKGLAWLLGFQLVGEAIARALALPVPGPVIGMLLLLAVLIRNRGGDPDLRSTAAGLLQHLSLLFVPAGTGVMLHIDRLGQEWQAIVAALVASTLLGLATAGLTLHLLSRHRDKDHR